MTTGIGASRWLIVVGCLLMLAGYVAATPSKAVDWIRARAFNRPEHQDGYITDESTLTSLERWVFRLERPHTKWYRKWRAYQEFLSRLEHGILLLLMYLTGTSLVLNAVGL